MLSTGKAILAVAGDVGLWAEAHRTLVLLLLLAVVVAGQQFGIVEPLDWWGTGEEIR
jgi:hypothetical protein